MKLNDKNIQNKELWESKGFILPRYDREQVREKTIKEPVWLHFGAGNIFRSFTAVIQQNLLDGGLQDTGIIVAEDYDYEIIDTAFSPYDNLSVSVVLKSDGGIEKSVLASVVESVKTDGGGFSRLKEIFAAKTLRLVTFTITEKGYSLCGSDGSFFPVINDDFKTGPVAPMSFFGKLTALCYHRFIQGAAPLTLVSMDNCSHNGTRLFDAVHYFAVKWAENALVERDFLWYINDKSLLSFPWTMVDKITPGPDDDIAAILGKTGLEGMQAIKTGKNTNIAAYVNAEESGYFVIEDAFPNGRPPLEKAGVIFTDRKTVEKVERMKVCTCLNPLHTGLSLFSCLLSYKKISDAMKDKLLHKLVQLIADEGLPVVTDPKIISPQEFVNTFINVRLPNPFIPDTPQRIATDSSLKIPIRFGETLKAYAADEKLDMDSLRAIPLVIAGWFRYLRGVDDDGSKYEISPDPILSLENPEFLLFTDADDITPLLSRVSLFGVDLIETGIAEKVKDYFAMMMEGPGAVRKTLESVLEDSSLHNPCEGESE